MVPLHPLSHVSVQVDTLEAFANIRYLVTVVPHHHHNLVYIHEVNQLLAQMPTQLN